MGGREGEKHLPVGWKMRGEKRAVVTGRSWPTRLMSVIHFASLLLAREGGREGGRGDGECGE